MREVASQIVNQIVQHAAIAAMTVDDYEVAGGQRPDHVAGKVAQQRDEVLDAQAKAFPAPSHAHARG